MRNGVDLEGEAEIIVCGVQNCLASREAGVVDEDCWVTDFRLDNRTTFFDSSAGTEIAVEV
jgi:hypothetical protein